MFEDSPLMSDIKDANKRLSEEAADLRQKLAEAMEVLDAIRNGSVDALAVSSPQGDRIYTLKGADYTYRVLIETMTEGAVILSEDGAILYCNSRFAEMARTPIESVIGGYMSDFVAASEKDRFAGFLERSSFENIREEMRIRHRGGAILPVLLSMRPLATEEMKSVCMVVTDLSQQKHAETELSRRAEQLSRLTSELTLSEQRERRRLAKILHDHLQQLLVGAKLGLEATISRVAPEYRAALEQTAGLLRESLETSRSLTVELCPPILYEGGLVQALQWLSRWMKEKHGLAVDLQAETQAVPEGESMKVLLFESVRELLFNVVKHAGADAARVEIIPGEGEFLKIVVNDRGTGFDPKNLWENADPAAGGFGLFSIRERLSLLGGRFDVASTPGKGTTVSLIAPFVEGRPVKPQLRVFPSPAPDELFIPSDSDVAKKFRVMLVDDHPVMRNGLSTLLNLHADIETVGEAADGEEAVNMARKLRPDVILMDISMPKMNGIEATRIIHSEFPEIRIIGLSMYDKHDQATAMINAGASAYRSKGENTNLLLAAIRGEAEAGA